MFDHQEVESEHAAGDDAVRRTPIADAAQDKNPVAQDCIGKENTDEQSRHPRRVEVQPLLAGHRVEHDQEQHKGDRPQEEVQRLLLFHGGLRATEPQGIIDGGPGEIHGYRLLEV